MTASAVPPLAPLTINPPAFEHRRLARSAFGARVGGVRTENCEARARLGHGGLRVSAANWTVGGRWRGWKVLRTSRRGCRQVIRFGRAFAPSWSQSG